MYQDPNFNSTNKWQYNCSNINDLDYLVRWGNFEGPQSLTIKRDNMTKIVITMRCWNSKDGWITKTSTKNVTGGSTSDPYTFTNLGFNQAFARFQADPDYWGTRYTMEGKLEIYFNAGESIETYLTSVSGCFRRYDPNYYMGFNNCYPADVQCNEG